MGLDMYLFKQKKRRNDDDEYNELVVENRKEVMYWRKANQIRKWIVDKCGYPDDGNMISFSLSKENLEALKNDCNKVLDVPSLASILLPVSSGFLFGDQNYGELYMNQVRETRDNLDKIIQDTDWDKEEIIYLEWW